MNSQVAISPKQRAIGALGLVLFVVAWIGSFAIPSGLSLGTSEVRNDMHALVSSSLFDASSSEFIEESNEDDFTSSSIEDWVKLVWTVVTFFLVATVCFFAEHLRHIWADVAFLKRRYTLFSHQKIPSLR